MDYLEYSDEFVKPEHLWTLYLGERDRFADVLKGVPTVTDDHPWIEYPYFRSKRAEYFRAPEILKWAPVSVPFLAKK